MWFQVVDNRFIAPARTPCVVLERTTWDDHGHKTMFRAYHVDGEHRLQPVGRVKILQRGEDVPDLPLAPFQSLDDTFCSLGQEVEYYDWFHGQGGDVGRESLVALRDLALTPAIEAAFPGERGLKGSLLRFPNAEIARDHARTLFQVEQGSDEGPLEFTFSCRLEGFHDDHRVELSFPAQKEDKLGRIMALAGRNGTGKTRLMAQLAQVLSGLSTDLPEQTLGSVEPEQRTRVVVVSFNPFDRFTTPRENVPGGDYAYYGLRSPHSRAHGVADQGEVEAHGEVDIVRALERLDDSIERIWRMGAHHQEDWQNLLRDTHIFANEPDLIDPFDPPTRDQREMRGRIKRFARRLRSASAGHQLLVFTVTALVESVRSRSVLLLDEPETYLHPRLLSTLIRLLYDVLVKRGAYAVIATHSPVVMQEIPGRHIRLLRICEGRLPLATPYPHESFGESLDEIARQAFGVEEGDRSYLTIFRQLARDGHDRAAIEDLFDGLGLRARLLLRDVIERRSAE